MIFELTCEFRAAEKGGDGMALKIFARARPFPKAETKLSSITETWILPHPHMLTESRQKTKIGKDLFLL